MLGSQAPVSCAASWRCCSCCSNSVGPRFPARWRLSPRKGHLDLVKTFVCENAANYVCAWEKGCYGTALTRLNWAQQKEDSFEYFSDGCLVVEDGKVLACGNFDELVQQHAGMTIKVRFNSQRLRARHRMKRATLTIACPHSQDCRPHLICPGFCDSHVHFPQMEVPRTPHPHVSEGSGRVCQLSADAAC